MKTHPSPCWTLSNLERVELNLRHRRMLETAAAECNGPPAWSIRKSLEAGVLCALAQVSGRIHVHWLDLATSFRSLVTMRTPVPCMRSPGGPVHITWEAVLGITYPEIAVQMPQPGYSFVQVLEPRNVFHSHIASGPDQCICLGSIPAGIRLREILFMTYGALTFQNVQLQNLAAGIMNAEALDYWTHKVSEIPLTNDPFVSSEVRA